ncbi:hypothetical protein N7519_011772 [Penicillium mononematosum]|uniref:uncharacterized protein n=1 Tax=Penicillium mononematosum TaxID=268346 RepID=UPI0025498AF7|nr:uncharacterized protein N7519_011772 [Penicillium mononematosum]KAJ6181311.1 hypothetical protein N7519_011772 [Penicillium mononematosum]
MTNTSDAMANVKVTEKRHGVYIVKYNFDRSRPERDWAIYVKTEARSGDIHIIASKDANAPCATLVRKSGLMRSRKKEKAQCS